MANIHHLFKIQRDNQGSDLHLSAGHPPLCRIHGEIRPINRDPLTNDQVQSLVYEILTPAQKESFEATRDLDFGYEAPELSVRFRGNVFWGRMGMSAVFRLIPSQVMSAQQLNLPPVIIDMVKQKKGLIVVTGATGSGKSTTLAAMVDYINKNRKEHILTIEDPIEFIHANHLSLISQREVGTHTLSFAKALRAGLREDPDVILVGELRDLETAELAITAAETGHLVLATLHTATAAKTVDRLINIFSADQQSQIRSMLSESLKGVIAQNLLRSTDGKRVAAFEILVNIPAISSLIREGKTHQIPSAMQTGKAQGMLMMDDYLRMLLINRRITLEETMKYASSTFSTTLRNGSSGFPAENLQR